MYVSLADRKSIALTATKEATKDNDIIFGSSARKLMDERVVLHVRDV